MADPAPSPDWEPDDFICAHFQRKWLPFLPWGAELMTLECGIRFLTDYLEGDVYFHIQRTGQNLDRCRTQCKLVADMEAHWGELEAIVNQYR